MYLENDCSNNTISGNMANNNVWSGIHAWRGDDNNITNNVVNGNNDGIYFQESSNNIILGNIVNNNTNYGIYMAQSHHNLISENDVFDNLDSGIRLYGDETPSHHNNITDNVVYDNNVGIYFDESCDYNRITKTILKNNSFGIIFDHQYCQLNSIHENFFLKNGIHALDSGTNNDWNSTTIGNYWDNHTGPDIDDDGIVDVLDIYTAALAFGSYPEHPNWNCNADANRDNKIDIEDIYLIAINFGKTE